MTINIFCLLRPSSCPTLVIVCWWQLPGMVRSGAMSSLHLVTSWPLRESPITVTPPTRYNNCDYHTIPGKRPWVLNITQDYGPHECLPGIHVYTCINTIHLYGSCYIDPLKCSAWALTWEWVLARNTTVFIFSSFYCLFVDLHVHLYITILWLCLSIPPPSRSYGLFMI